MKGAVLRYREMNESKQANTPLIQTTRLSIVGMSCGAVKAYAEQKGLSSSNAEVRVFRAREALKKRVIESCGTCAEHGCVNCAV